MMEYLFGLVSRLGHWGYVIIFVAAALECAAFAGLVVPGESLVLVSGFLAHVGLLNLDAVIAAAAGGAIVGDNIGYRLGERLGRPWLLRYGPRLAHAVPPLPRLQRGGGSALDCVLRAAGILARGELADGGDLDRAHVHDCRGSDHPRGGAGVAVAAPRPPLTTSAPALSRS